eukprot:TRINITY_DN8820_c0_g1_i3.p1 TRINITY_DN8820_c0_g1~~TRINITY_DN8820_c0_g1_i3.p1  ORF type:complete len:309 (-),score=36.52 TRINITY_DN8820_c0_g1_i3:317-1243(-)
MLFRSLPLFFRRSPLISHKRFCTKPELSFSIRNHDIYFSQVREDPKIDVQVTRKLFEKDKRPIDVLMIASGGCSLLSLVLESHVNSVDVFDVNPSQLYLVELRMVAIKVLNREEYMDFIGLRRPPSGKLSEYRNHNRVNTYCIRLRQYLGTTARQFWDGQVDSIAFGINRCGRFEHLFRELSFECYHVDPIISPHLNPEVCTMSNPDWVRKFQKNFETKRLSQIFGPDAVNYSMDRNFGDHFGFVTQEALKKWKISENYFLSQIFWDDVPEDSQLPLYIQEEQYEKLKQITCSTLTFVLLSLFIFTGS